jgi:coatomer subunit gamma
MGALGPSTPSPARYIRFIFNRVILENAVVRAAAVATLGVFAVRVPDLRPSIVILLKRSLQDEDDEVRDRTAILVSSFEYGDGDLKYLLDETLPMSFMQLERSVRAFNAHPIGLESKLTLASLPIIEDSYVPTVLPAVRAGSKKKASSTSTEIVPETVDPASELYKLPEFSSLGRAFRSSAECALTENEMEYVVTCTKHIFETHVVLQFSILNTIDDQRLKNAFVKIEAGDEESYSVDKVIPASVARYGEPSNCFVSLRRNADAVPCSFNCELHFQVLQVDPTTGEIEGDENGFDEEYPLETLEVSTNDFMAKTSTGDFRRSWEQMGSDGEVLEKFALQFRKLDDAVTAVTDFLGMQAVDGTSTVASDGGSKRSHTLHLCGVFVGNIPVLVRAQLQMDDSSTGVVLKMAVRSPVASLNRLVAECIR